MTGDQMQFDQYLTTRNLAPATIAQYDSWARRYERWCYSQRIVPDLADPLDLAGWADTIPETWASRKAAQSALRHYFAWVGRTDAPEQAIRVPRKPRMKPRPLTRDQLHDLRVTAQLVGGRQGLATLLGLYLGARRIEVAWMTWDGWADGRMRWTRAKTGDITELRAHPALAAALEEQRPRATSMYLFPGDRGRPHVSPTTVWEWIRHVGKVAGVELTPHQLRHSFATHALQVTHDLRGVQEAMGHRDPAMTAGYSAVSDDQLDAVVDALDF